MTAKSVRLEDLKETFRFEDGNEIGGRYVTSRFFFPRIFQKIETSERITLLSFTGKVDKVIFIGGG